MWPQEERDHDSSKHRMASSSSSSSSSSSPSPFTSAGVPPTPMRTMEEVWKDITLSAATPVLGAHGHQPCYHHLGEAAPNAAATTLTHFRGMILPDFLARPFRGSTPASKGGDMGLLGSPLVTLPPNPSQPPHPTVLCLTSGGDFQYVDTGVGRPGEGLVDPWGKGHNRSHGTARDRPHSSYSPSDSMGPTAFFSSCANRRSPEKQQQQQQQQLERSDGSGHDRRHKRMIKNRESAARSRARKQAYTNELEFEVNHLTEENQRLRRQHEELRARVAAQLLPTRRPLQRSSSAPF